MKRESSKVVKQILWYLGTISLSLSIGVLLPTCSTLPVSAEPITFSNVRSGNWYPASQIDPYIWLRDPSGDHLYPQTGDTVNITGGGSPVIVNGAATCSFLNIFPGTATGNILSLGSYTLTVDGATNWAGGMIGGGTFNNTVTVTLSGSGMKTYWGTLRNNNRINHVDGTLGIFASSNVDNQAGAIYDMQEDVNIDFGGGGGGSPIFYNRSGATFRKSAGSGTSTVANTSFYNEGGTIDVQSGTLHLSFGGGTSTGGTFNVASGAVLDLTPTSGGDLIFTGMYTGSGGGQVKLTGGRISQGGTGGFTLNFPGSMFQWGGGSLQGNVTNSGVLNLVDSTAKIPIVSLKNNGTINHIAGTLGIFASSNVDNQAGAIYDMQGDVNIDFGGGGGGSPIFYNRSGATFRKSAGSGTSTVANTSFYNEGATIDVQSGTLHLSNGGGISTGGTFNVAGGAVLDLTPTSGGDLIFTGMYTGSGGGQVKLTGGRISQGGTGGFTLNFPGSMFQWGGGSLQGNVTNSGVLNLVGSTTKIPIVSLKNNGVINHIAGTLGIFASSNLDNQAGAIYDMQGDVTISSGGGGGSTPVFYNRDGATLRKSAGTETATITNASLSNVGTLEVLSGTLNISGAVTQMSGSTLTDGSWKVGAGAALNITTGQNITTNQAEIILDGAGAAFSKISALANNQGNFSVLNGAIFNTTAGLTNSGSMAIGTGSTVTGAGGFTQGVTGIVNIQIGGPPQSGQFGQLNVSGTATLNGTLNISLTNGFVPSVGQSFQVMSFNNPVGEFDAINGLVIGNGLVFHAIFSQNSLVLKVGRAGSFFADYDGDESTDVAGFHLSTDQFFTGEAGNMGQYGWGGADCYPLIWDYNGDGSTEISIYHIPTNQWFVKGVPGDNLGQFGWGGDQSIPVPGDYNGDGVVERAFYHWLTNEWFIEFAPGQPPDQIAFGWGGADCIPIAADYDGDGTTDMMLYHVPTNQWFVYGIGNLGQFGWNGAECLPVPGDYDGDGKTEIGIYHIPTNQWFWRNEDGTDHFLGQYGWGGLESFPIPGDYGGNGVMERAFYRPGENWWFIEGQPDFKWGWDGANFMPITSQMAVYNWFRFVLGRFQ